MRTILAEMSLNLDFSWAVSQYPNYLNIQISCNIYSSHAFYLQLCQAFCYWAAQQTILVIGVCKLHIMLYQWYDIIHISAHCGALTLMHVASEEKSAGWGKREMTEMSKSAKNCMKKQLRMSKTITARESNCSLWRPPFHNSWVTSWQGGVVRSRANQSRPTDTTPSVFQSRAE